MLRISTETNPEEDERVLLLTVMVVFTLDIWVGPRFGGGTACKTSWRREITQDEVKKYSADDMFACDKLASEYKIWAHPRLYIIVRGTNHNFKIY
jgi:hypothetical protein